MNSNFDLIKHIKDYYLRHELIAVDEQILGALIREWPELSQERNSAFDHEDLKSIQTFIRTREKAEQNLYQQTYKQLIGYLIRHSHYRFPPSEQRPLQSKDESWFERVYQEITRSELVRQWYEKEKSLLVSQQREPDVAFVAIAFSIEVAPLSVHHLSKLIGDHDCIDSELSLLINVVHNRKMTEEQAEVYHTTYRLTPFIYRLLLNTTSRVTPKKLLSAINESLSPVLERSFDSVLDFKATMECVWLHSHTLPLAVLSDLSTPERHVALMPRKPEPLPKSGLKVQNVLSQQLSCSWPHRRQLIPLIRKSQNLKQLRKTVSVMKTLTYNSTDLLPKLLYDYTLSLIFHGGAVKQELALGSIVDYCGIEKLFLGHSLSYGSAANDEDINQWAMTVYDTLSSKQKKLVRYFFDFLSTQPLTEGLNLSLFSLPYEPPSVSAFRISPNELDTLIRTTLGETKYGLISRLFQVVTASLGFHAMLRRGEILRLRIKDVQPLPYLNDQCFSLTVSNTDEGRTKSGKHRLVSICLPPHQAELLLLLLKLKLDEPLHTPLIGLHNETLAQRTESYLQPISKRLKRLLGIQTNFHHLRHSGAHVFYEQLLRLAYETLFSASRNYTDDNHFVNEKSTVFARLHYWLQGNEFLDVNPAILFDELCRQLGHEHYATTRWSYLHGIEWLAEIIEKEEIAYTHAELRYIFNLSPTSNDISRRIKTLNPDVYVLSIEERKQDPVFINQHRLIRALTHSRHTETRRHEKLPLLELLISSPAPLGLYSTCEQRSLSGHEHQLSFDTLSALAQYSSGSQWRKGTMNALIRTFEHINTQGLTADNPYFSVFVTPSKKTGLDLKTLLNTELKWLPMKFIHHLNKDAKESLVRRTHNTRCYFPIPILGECHTHHRNGTSILEVQFHHRVSNHPAACHELTLLTDVINELISTNTGI